MVVTRSSSTPLRATVAARPPSWCPHLPILLKTAMGSRWKEHRPSGSHSPPRERESERESYPKHTHTHTHTPCHTHTQCRSATAILGGSTPNAHLERRGRGPWRGLVRLPTQLHHLASPGRLPPGHFSSGAVRTQIASHWQASGAAYLFISIDFIALGQQCLLTFRSTGYLNCCILDLFAN